MKLFWILLLSCLFALTACQQEDGLLETTSLRLRPNERTCSLDPLEASPGNLKDESAQGAGLSTLGYQPSGSAQGVGIIDPINETINPDNEEMELENVTSATELAAEIASVFPPEGLENDVVILLVDNYGKGLNNVGSSVYDLNPTFFSLSPSVFTTYDTLKAKLDKMFNNGLISHGAMVREYTLDLLTEVLQVEPVLQSKGRAKFVLDNATIRVQPIEVSGFDTQQIKDAIVNTINYYKKYGFQNFVTNMSFTLENCEDVEKFRKSPEPSIVPWLTPEPPGIGPGDPLYDFIHDEENKAILFVASAGNYGGEQPRQPGLMPNVVSVSASLGNSGTLATFSNRAEVMLDGAYLRTKPESDVVWLGNSFSAPAVAVGWALDRSTNHPLCEGPELAHGSFTNLTLVQATQDHCL